LDSIFFKSEGPVWGQPAIIWASLTLALMTLPKTIDGTPAKLLIAIRIILVNFDVGEVAPIMFTGAAYYLPYLPSKLNDQFMEMGYHIYVMATQSPDIEATKPILYGTVLVLLTLTFLLNFIAIYIRSSMRRKRALFR